MSVLKSFVLLRGKLAAATLVEHGRKSIEENYIEKKLINKELKRIDSAMDKTILDLTKVKNKISLNENSNVLLFGCEGDADEELYQKLLSE